VSIEANKDLVRREIHEIWIERKIDALARFIGDELLEEAREHTQQFLDAFSDIDIVIEDLIAEGDKVMARLSISATHSGPFAGRPATGEPISFGSFRIYQVVEGKIVETWAMQDRLGLMEQLGLVQTSACHVQWAGGDEQRE
jgi:predicted ester cyclase